MTRLVCSLLLAAALLLPAFANEKAKTAALDPKYRKWLTEEVGYIISDYEREAFLSLTDDSARDAFVRLFWEARDPTPGTPENEAQAEHLKRVADANRLFRRGGPNSGWKTARGKVYIQLGPPRDRVSYPFEARLYPIERWFYQGDPARGLPPFFNVVFFQPYGVGDYELYEPAIHGPEKLVGGDPIATTDRQQALRQLNQVNPELAIASLSLIPTEPADLDSGVPSPASQRLMGRLADINNRLPYSREYVERVLRGEANVTVEYSFKELRMRAVFHGAYLPNGDSALHYLVEIPPESLTLSNYDGKVSGAIEVVGRVFAADGTTPVLQLDERVTISLTSEQLKALETSPFAFIDLVPLLPGSYRVNLVIRNLVSREFGTVEGSFTIPARKPAALALTPVLLARAAQDAPPDRASLPFVLGNEAFYPAVDGLFSPQDDLVGLVQLSYPAKDYALGDEIIVRYEVRSATASAGDPPRLSGAQRARVNPAYDHGLQRIPFRLPLGELGPGAYVAMVTATGKAGHVVTEAHAFSVRSGAVFRAPWIWVNRRNTDSGTFAMMLAEQHLLRGEEESAIRRFESACESRGAEAVARQRLGELLVSRRDFERAVAALAPLDGTTLPNTYTLMLLGLARSGAGDNPGAIRAYERASERSPRSTQILNLLAEEWLRAGDPGKAAQTLGRSLEITPDQPKIERIRNELLGHPTPPPAP